jgi:hypothetical protein
MKSDLDVAQAKAADILEVAHRHGARLKKRYGEWVGPCPGCSGDDRFSIKNRLWYCRGCGKGGDVIALEMHLSASTFVEAVLALTGGGPGGRREPTPEEIAAREAQEKQRLEETAAKAEKNNRRAAEIIARLQPVIGTPGEAHLREARRIDVESPTIRQVLHAVDTLGWSERTYFHQPDPDQPLRELHAQYLGAIIAILTDPVTAERTGGITRTFVHQGRKIGKAISLGGAGRPGIVRLSPDDEVLKGLHLCEGLESAMAAMAMGFVPMWAAGSTSQMAGFPVIDGVEALTVIADNDEAGLKAGRQVCQRWANAGRKAAMKTPKRLGEDANDIVKRRARG